MKEYSRVKLLTDKFKDEGVVKGNIGYIIEIYDDGNYEVEFSDSGTGVTIAQIVVSPDEIELAELEKT
jgi:hypothetical protein